MSVTLDSTWLARLLWAGARDCRPWCGPSGSAFAWLLLELEAARVHMVSPVAEETVVCWESHCGTLNLPPERLRREFPDVGKKKPREGRNRWY